MPRPYRRNTFLSTVGVKPSSAPLLSGSLQKCSCSSLKCAPEPLPQSRSGPWFHRDETSPRSEEHTSELQSLMRISYAVFCLKKKISQNSPTSDRATIHKPTTPP